MRAEEAFNAVCGALVVYAQSVLVGIEREVKLTDLVKDDGSRELLLSLDDRQLQAVAVEAMDKLAGKKPPITVTITFLNPGMYKIMRPLPIPVQRQGK